MPVHLGLSKALNEALSVVLLSNFSLVIGGVFSWNVSKTSVAAKVSNELRLRGSLVGSMLTGHLLKCMLMTTRATLMSMRLCWWRTALIFGLFCSGCNLLHSSCRICVKTRLCLLSVVLLCTDQDAGNNMSLVKATSSEGSRETLANRMPLWNAASLTMPVADNGCMRSSM